MTFDEFVNTWRSDPTPFEFRAGQYLMYLLNYYRPELYCGITGTDYDPFYVDWRINTALEWLRERW